MRHSRCLAGFEARVEKLFRGNLPPKPEGGLAASISQAGIKKHRQKEGAVLCRRKRGCYSSILASNRLNARLNARLSSPGSMKLWLKM